MTETWTSATLAALTTMLGIWKSMILVRIGYYGRNLDISNFGRKRLLWPKPKKKIKNKKKIKKKNKIGIGLNIDVIPVALIPCKN